MNRSYRRTLKRAVDLGCSLLGLIALSPLMLLLAGLVRVRLGAPVLFRQRRIGLGGQPFILLKFRTMNNRCDAQGQLLPDGERLTGLGRFLRNHSLDELPQLWNVVRGEMSLIGPRPLLPQYLERYTARQKRRHEVMPGMTGWAQVSGRNTLSWDVKLELDVWYVENASLLLDARIFCKTLLTLARRTDVNARGHATMPEFAGPADR